MSEEKFDLGYDAWKIVVTLVMAMVGMCFLIPGMACITEKLRKCMICGTIEKVTRRAKILNVAG